MSPDYLSKLIEESIQLELNVAELYRIFSTNDPKNDFWWQLHLEEKSHATLIRAARDSFINRGKFPASLIAGSIDELHASNTKTEALIERCTLTPPSPHEACRIAVELENEAGELHFTEFMDKEANSPLETVFQQLNRDDKEHGKRIRAHAQSIGTPL